jgi:cation diffusion facilitator CzcD-associated flavoprotein CzcO
MVNNTLRQESGAVPRRIAIDSIRHMGSDSGKVLPNAGKRPNVAPITVMAAVAATGTGMEAEVTELGSQTGQIFHGAIVIGAGAAGLAAAHALIKAGVPTLVLEKESRLAEPWYRRHERLHLNSHRDLSTLPGVDYPAGTPAFPHKNAVVRHLNQFSQAHGLPVRLGVAVEEIAFNGDYWTVKTSAGPRLARQVVIATARDLGAIAALARRCGDDGNAAPGFRRLDEVWPAARLLGRCKPPDCRLYRDRHRRRAVRDIKAGKIVVLPQVREFTRDGVFLDNGNRIVPEIVIAATGYRTGLQRMVGKLGVLDGKGVPLFNGGEADPKLPGLWFTGMRPSIRGCFANARIQANAITQQIVRQGR